MRMMAKRGVSPRPTRGSRGEAAPRREGLAPTASHGQRRSGLFEEFMTVTRSLRLVVAMMLSLGVPAAFAAPAPHTLALAAGYKAAFLCSGMFDAGESEATATADDLEGIYPEFQEAVRTLPAKIDREARTVSVAFDDRLPPRIAAWRPGLGCAQLPIGAGPEAIAARGCCYRQWCIRRAPLAGCMHAPIEPD